MQTDIAVIYTTFKSRCAHLFFRALFHYCLRWIAEHSLLHPELRHPVYTVKPASKSRIMVGAGIGIR